MNAALIFLLLIFILNPAFGLLLVLLGLMIFGFGASAFVGF